MAVSVRAREIQKLVRFYRQAVRDVAKRFVGGVDWEKPRSFSQIQQSLNVLDDLDEKTDRWAKRNISKLYRAASREAEKELKKAGVTLASASRAKSFGVVNRQAIEALLVDPEVGFLTGLKEGTDQIRARMKTIQNQAKLLTQQQKLFDATIARVGFLEGRGLNEIRDQLVDEMVSFKSNSELLFTKKAAKLPPGQIIKETADLPFVKIPDSRAAAGFRRLRVDKYAELLARTKTAQATNLARRNKALEHGIELVQISKNRPLQNDACFLYLGKVFALTPSAKAEFGVPLVSELPNGGAPFHPHCTHQELQFVVEFEDRRERELSMSPPPAWALNRTWTEVQREFERRGGKKSPVASARRLNEQVAKGRTFDTGGRRRRGTGDVDGPGPGTQGPSQGPQGPAQPPVVTGPAAPSPDELSIVRKDLESSLLGRIEDIATGAELANSFDGIASTSFQTMVSKRSRSLVNRAVNEIPDLSSGAKERLVQNVPSSLTLAATKAAERRLVRRSIGRSAREAMDAEAKNLLNSPAGANTRLGQEKLRKAGLEAAKREIPTGLKLSQDEIDGIVSEALDPIHAAAVKSAQELDKRFIQFFSQFESKWESEAEDLIRGVIAKADRDEELLWKLTAESKMRLQAAKDAEQFFDDADLVDLVRTNDNFRPISSQVVDDVVAEFRELKDEVESGAKSLMSSRISTITDVNGKDVTEAKNRLKEVGLTHDALEKEKGILQKKVEDAAKQSLNSTPGSSNLPPFMRKDIDLQLRASFNFKGSSSLAIEKAHDEIVAIQKTLFDSLSEKATAAAQKAVDDFTSMPIFKSSPLPKPETLEQALRSIASEQAEDILSPLKAQGVTTENFKKFVDQTIDGIAKKKVLQVQSKMGASLEGAMPQLKFKKNGVPTKKSVVQVTERFAEDEIDNIAASIVFDNRTLTSKDLRERAIEEARIFVRGRVGEFFTDAEIEDFIKKAKIPSKVNAGFEAMRKLRNDVIAGKVGIIDREDAIRKIRNIRLGTRPKSSLPRQNIVTPSNAPRTPAKKPIVVDPEDFPALDEVEELRVVRRLGGSTGAELVEDTKGRKFVRKRGTTADQIREEFRAEQIYRSLGVPVPESQLYNTSRGPVKLSAFKDGRELGSLNRVEQLKVFDQLKEDFGVDAALANWDVAGLNLDNILVDANGVAWRIDVGGSLRFRATGNLKGQAWNENPTELWSLLDPKVNQQSAQVFSGLTHEQRLAALDRVVAKRDEVLDLIDDPGLRDTMRRRLDEVEDIVVTARRMQDDLFNTENFVHDINRASVFMHDAGLRQRLPQSLKKGRSSSFVVDENGIDFDRIRGEGGSTRFVQQYIDENGGDFGLIREWFDAQGDSSWRATPRAVKYLMYTERKGLDKSSVYWGQGHMPNIKTADEGFERARVAFNNLVESTARTHNVSKDEGELIVRRSFRMFSAYQQQRLRLVNIPGNDIENKTIRLFRKENRAILEANGLSKGARGVKMEKTGRGLAESTSLFDPPSVHGDTTTVQIVPHHRVLGTWWDGIHRTFLYSDSENEIIAMLDNLFFDIP